MLMGWVCGAEMQRRLQRARILFTAKVQSYAKNYFGDVGMQSVGRAKYSKAMEISNIAGEIFMNWIPSLRAIKSNARTPAFR